MRSGVRWMVMLLALTACKKDPEPAETHRTATAAPTAVSTAPTGIEACDAYLAAAARCLQKGDAAELRASMEQYRKQAAQAETKASREAVSIGCEVAREALGDDCEGSSP